MLSFKSFIVEKRNTSIFGSSKLSSIKWGETKRFSLFPKNIQEAKGNTAGQTGSQVEHYCVLYLHKMLEDLGFNVSLKYGDEETDKEAFVSRIDGLQSKIDNNFAKNNKVDLRDTERMQHGYATAKRIIEELKPLIDYPPALHKVTLSQLGTTASGLSKADFQIEFTKPTHDKFIETVKRVLISHKFDHMDGIRGTQTLPLPFLYNVITGHSTKSSKLSKENRLKIVYDECAPQNMEIDEFDDRLSEFNRLNRNKQERERDGEKRYSELRVWFFKLLSEQIKKNPQNLFKMMGFEQGIEYFFSKKNRKGEIATSTSLGTNRYKEVCENLFNNEILERLSVDCYDLGQNNKIKKLGVRFKLDNKILYNTEIRPVAGEEQGNIQIGGLGYKDTDDRELVNYTPKIEDLFSSGVFPDNRKEVKRDPMMSFSDYTEKREKIKKEKKQSIPRASFTDPSPDASEEEIDKHIHTMLDTDIQKARAYIKRNKEGILWNSLKPEHLDRILDNAKQNEDLWATLDHPNASVSNYHKVLDKMGELGIDDNNHTKVEMARRMRSLSRSRTDFDQELLDKIKNLKPGSEKQVTNKPEPEQKSHHDTYYDSVKKYLGMYRNASVDDIIRNVPGIARNTATNYLSIARSELGINKNHKPFIQHPMHETIKRMILNRRISNHTHVVNYLGLKPTEAKKAYSAALKDLGSK